MIATLDTTRERRQRAAREQWRDPLARARLLAGQLVAAERRRVDRLVEDHLYLLDRAAGYWHKRLPAVPYEDLHQVAFLGLRRAAETWDPFHASGAAFSTWAFHGLNGAIRDDLPTLMGGPIRAPKRPAFPRPVVASLDDADGAPEPEDEGTASDPYELACRAEDRERLGAALGKLRHERDARVIAMRYGLEGPPMTLREIGEALGVGVERARQLELRALAELRAALGQ